MTTETTNQPELPDSCPVSHQDRCNYVLAALAIGWNKTRDGDDLIKFGNSMHIMQNIRDGIIK